MSNKVTYKNYNMNQLQIPMDITDWIEENHISKLINQVVEGIDEKILRQSYKGGGRCSYHPKMMRKKNRKTMQRKPSNDMVSRKTNTRFSYNK